MKTAVIVIAICEVIRMLQNLIPIILSLKDAKERSGLYGEFIKSLQKDDREWAEDLLREFCEKERKENADIR